MRRCLSASTSCRCSANYCELRSGHNCLYRRPWFIRRRSRPSPDYHLENWCWPYHILRVVVTREITLRVQLHIMPALPLPYHMPMWMKLSLYSYSNFPLLRLHQNEGGLGRTRSMSRIRICYSVFAIQSIIWSQSTSLSRFRVTGFNRICGCIIFL